MAAESIIEVENTHAEAAGIYLEKLKPVINVIGSLLDVNKKVEDEAADDKEKILDSSNKGRCEL